MAEAKFSGKIAFPDDWPIGGLPADRIALELEETFKVSDFPAFIAFEKDGNRVCFELGSLGCGQPWPMWHVSIAEMADCFIEELSEGQSDGAALVRELRAAADRIEAAL